MNTKSVIQIAEVVNGVVHITLPKDFHAKRVELTIVPLENDETQLSAFQQFLLDSPEMTDDEYLKIEEKKTAFTEMEIICLDTNVLIAHKRAKKGDKDKSFLFRLTTKPYQFAVSSITVYELLRGDNQGEDVYWKAMFSNMTVLDFDSNCAEYAAKIYQDLKSRGLLIEAEDLLIAATTLGNQMKLATGNVKHFARVAGLELVTDDGLF